ncbi:Rod binding protein [Roseivivax sediminis]|uniref:Rod binding protein n=2 Tax=Roseivivax sediminis TaxID=936889 RepID=A0A1I1U8A6_9RHOB|nr:Rod binding protein [Roseivivax sediminis]
MIAAAGTTIVKSGQPLTEAGRTLRDAAVGLEAQFLSEMLKAARFGKAPDAFGGGAGEDQFASLLRDSHARQLAEAGGIGLAEQIFNMLKDSSHD